jgi:hypothetical protein
MYQASQSHAEEVVAAIKRLAYVWNAASSIRNRKSYSDVVFFGLSKKIMMGATTTSFQIPSKYCRMYHGVHNVPLHVLRHINVGRTAGIN